MCRTRPLRKGERLQAEDPQQLAEEPSKKLFVICYVFFLTLLANPCSLWAVVPGDLDPTFGNGGIVTTSVGAGANAVALQPDGKIVAAGGSGSNFALVRYNPNGSLDTSFGSGGIVTTSVGAGANAVALQPDGKIVAAGSKSTGGLSDFVLVRYNPDGSLDASFGSGGIIVTPIGSGNDNANAVALQADGKIVVAGLTFNGSNNDIALVRYNPDGSLDSTFGSGGIVTTSIGSSNDQASAMALQPDGKIVVAGLSSNGGPADFALVRYNPDGSLDTSFGTAGKVITDIRGTGDGARTIAVQTNGKITVAGQASQALTLSVFDIALARYNPDGSLDTSFGGTGKVITVIGSSGSSADAIVVQADDKIIVTGREIDGAFHSHYFILARYNPDGSLDASFGTGGKVTTPIGSESAANAAMLQGSKIVVAGFSSNGSNSEDFALARYLADYTPSIQGATLNTGDLLISDRDAFGGPGGVIRVDPITGVQTVVSAGGLFVDPRGIVVDANGDILVADENAFDGNGGVIRVNPATGQQTQVSSGGSFVSPRGLALDTNGDILVVDASAFGGPGGVIRVNPTTGAQTTVSTGGNFVSPAGITVATNGDIFVADDDAFDGNGAVFRVDRTTGAQTTISSGGNFSGPANITLAANGDILVSDYEAFGESGGAIRVNPGTGAQTTVSANGNFVDSSGIAVATNGDIFIADQNAFGGSGGVIRVNPTTGAQTMVSAGGDFSTPIGVAIVQLSAVDLAVTKSDLPDPVAVNQPLTYTVTVTNNGPGTATGVVMTDTLLSGVTFVSATPSQGTCSGTSSVSCSLGTLTNGSSVTVTIVVRPSAPGGVSNTAQVSANESDPVSSNNSATAVTTVNAPVNAPPTVNAISGASLNEGDTFNYNGSFTDPDSTTWTATVDYGDGGGTQPLALVGQSFALGHTYTDDGGYIIRVTVTDNQGGSGFNTATVNVHNVVPVIDSVVIEPEPSHAGQAVTATAAFHDPGISDTPFSCSVDYDGDGGYEFSSAATGGTCTFPSYVYETPGNYIFRVRVSDKDGAPSSRTANHIVDADADGDGFSTAQGDCNDANAAIHPGATEVCDGVDDNCDGQIDEAGQTTFYQDTDGDSYGNAASTTQACTAPAGYVGNSTDCNDTNAAIHPGATEVCNGIDDDCDGVVDSNPVFADAGACTQPPGGLVSWWPGDGDATDIVDGNSGTLQNGATFATGKVGQAFSFDGVSAFVSIPLSQNIFFSDTQPFTLELWFKPLSDDAAFFILKNANYGLQWQGSDQPLAFYNGNYHFSTKSSWNLGQWYHVAMVDDGGIKVRLYIDGVLDKEDDATPLRFEGGFPLEIGTYGGSYFNGLVDEVSIFNRALSAQEIADIFTAGSDGQCKVRTTQPLTQSCYSGPAGTGGVGVCHTGTQTCGGGQWGACGGEVIPSAELCDGLDNNCNSQIDEGAITTFYQDADGDGFGDSSALILACTAPATYVADHTDCNDGNAAIHPGATEVCDGVDNNCDGRADEGVVQTTFYADTDGDGFGNAASSTQACTQPTGYVADSTDCNDGSAAIHPGAAEICNGVDDNCNGQIDEGAASSCGDGNDCTSDACTAGACAHPFTPAGTTCSDSTGTCNGAGSCIPGGATPIPAFDPTSQFSIAANPNGAWAYGFTNTLGGTFTPFPDTNCNQFGDAGLPNWCTNSIYALSVASNGTTSPASAGTYTIPPDFIAFHPGPDGQQAILRWTAKCAGVWHISGLFQGVDRNRTTTDAHVLINGSSSFDALIDNFGVTQSFDLSRSLNTGDTVDFAVGFGSNGNYYGDPTGLQVAIHAAPFYRDADGDGYGTPADSVEACSAPAGYVASSTDCNDADAAIHVCPPPLLAVVAPNGGEVWAINSSHAIQWTPTGVSGNVKIELSRDGGTTWAVLFANTANDGTQNWTVAGPATNQARVRVSSVSNPSVWDFGDAAFTIGGGGVTVVAPNGGEVWPINNTQTIQWSSSGFPGNVKIELSRDGGTTWEVLFATTANDGTQNWKVTAPTTSQARIRVGSVQDASAVDASDNVFTVGGGSVTVNAPNGGEIWSIGSTQAIQWTANRITGNVKVELSRDGGTTWEVLFANTANDGTQNWKVTAPISNQARVRVSSVQDASAVDISDGVFMLGGGNITVLAPNGGEVWSIGSTKAIQWSASGITGNVKIELSRDGGTTWEVLFASTANDGTQNWRATAPATIEARIRVSGVNDPTVFDLSDALFRVQQ